MRQQQIRHPAGTFLVCSECKTEPRHIEHNGRTKRETMQADVSTCRHSLECRCGRSTGLCPTIDAAEADWGKRYSQIPLDLPAPTSRVVRLTRRSAKERAHG
jgi:hypothetical protein